MLGSIRTASWDGWGSRTRWGGSFLPSLENTWSGTAGKDLLFVPFVSLFLTFGMTLKELAVVGAPKHRAPRKHHQKLSR